MQRSLRRPTLPVLCLVVAFAGLATVSSASAAQEKPTATFTNGVLTVRGTDKGQRMSVVRHKGKVTLRVGGRKVALPKDYKNRICDEIRLKGRGGDDRMTIDTSGGPLPPVVLDGGAGDDTLTGSSSDDVLKGGRGDDVLSPGAGGVDDLDGGEGGDTYLIDAAQTGHAKLIERYEGPGDLVSFAPTATKTVTYRLGTDAHQLMGSYDVEDDFGGIESVTGGGGDDYLFTGRGDNTLRGGPGADHLYGSYEDDHDVLSGDAGDDVFIIYCIDSSVPRIDTITDFVTAEVVDLASGLSVGSGLGTTSVTIWDGVDECDVVQAANGHLWQPEDFV